MGGFLQEVSQGNIQEAKEFLKNNQVQEVDQGNIQEAKSSSTTIRCRRFTREIWRKQRSS